MRNQQKRRTKKENNFPKPLSSFSWVVKDKKVRKKETEGKGFGRLPSFFFPPLFVRFS